MENSFQNLVNNIIYVEEEPNLTNSTYTFIDFENVEAADGSADVVPHHITHKIEVAKVKDYICGSCDDSFMDRKELDAHLQSKHPQIFSLVSSYRKNETPKEKIVQEPTTKVVIIESCFTCKCGEKFRKFLELEQHVEIEHAEEFGSVPARTNEPSGDEIQCFEEEIGDSNDLIDEDDVRKEENIVVFDSTANTKPFVLEDNTTSFVTVDELIAKRVKTGNKPTRGSHFCKYCGEKFYRRTSFLDHMRDKHPDNPEYLCEICSKGFFDLPQLAKHKVIHNLKRFVCDICSKGFATKSKLTTHLDVHFRQNTVDCEICGKTFAAKSGYRVHLKKHLGMWDKNIACSICDARFRYQYNLDVHMKTHTGQKDFFCEICSKGFSMQRHLQAHIDSHNGLRKYSCETCGQKFIRRQTWRRHLITHSGEKPYRCEVCDAAYTDRRSLRKHLEKIHPGSNIEAFSKPLPSVPVVWEERTLSESGLVYTEMQVRHLS